MTEWLAAWGSLYSNHPALRTALAFLHIGGLVVAGGAAIVADRVTMMACRTSGPDREQALPRLTEAHSAVLVGLTLVVASGIALFCADVNTFLPSRIFWIKMALVVALLVNGARLKSAEVGAKRGEAAAWARLRTSAAASLALWLLTTLAGAALTNMG